MEQNSHVAAVRAITTPALSVALLAGIRNVLIDAFDGEFSDEDWEHTLGGCHFVVEGSSVVSHASVVPRCLTVAGQPFEVGYVEGVATARSHRSRGLASAVVRAASDHIRSTYEMGALGTNLSSFYGRFGWERWRGPTYVWRADGVFRSEEEEGFVMVLRLGPSAHLDLWAAISCNERPGGDW